MHGVVAAVDEVVQHARVAQGLHAIRPAAGRPRRADGYPQSWAARRSGPALAAVAARGRGPARAPGTFGAWRSREIAGNRDSCPMAHRAPRAYGLTESSPTNEPTKEAP